MSITHFDDLLATARAEPTPQRLLLVFATAELPAGATPEQRLDFAAGHGGELTPAMAVDKAVDEVGSFAALAEESRAAGPPWAIVFAAALSGRAGKALDSQAAEAPLQRMVESIRSGDLSGTIAFDIRGLAVQLG